jgi:hypothetical protein
MFASTHGFRRTGAWLALLALLTQALVPFAARAAAGSDRAFPGELCAVAPQDQYGAARVPAGQRAPDGPSQRASVDCPYCLVQGPQAALPPGAIPTLPVADTPAHLPPLFLHARHPLFAWSSAQPRAPPVLA